MDFWLRSATLQIGGNRYSMDDLAFDFEVPFEDSDELTTATVNAYNLSANTRNSIKKGDPVIINAGYEGDLGVIFVGQVSGLSHKHSSTEWTTKITAMLTGAYNRDDVRNAYSSLPLETNIGRLFNTLAWGLELVHDQSDKILLWDDLDNAQGAVRHRHQAQAEGFSRAARHPRPAR